MGSHVLDRLISRGISTAVVLRPNSDRQFISPRLSAVEVRTGSITDPPSLGRALEGVSHVIHCAGCTKAVGIADFYNINHLGTRQLVQSVNNLRGQVQRFVHISSLAAAGPATPSAPARETDPPKPVSEYGRSKLAGEMEVRNGCHAEFVIVRPPAVYGPRDRGFLSMFKAVASHLLPRSNPRQALSLVYVEDLSEAIVRCLDHPATAGKTYFAAAPEIVTGRLMAQTIARDMDSWTIPFPLPAALLWPICAGGELASRLTRKASLLSLQKFSELRAPGWVCDPSRLKQDTGFECKTSLVQGVTATLTWYRQNGWL